MIVRKEGATMETKRWYLINQSKNHQTVSINESIELLESGLTIAFPTETVYGLGADARDDRAVSRIFSAKGRPQDNPLIVHVATKKQLYALVKEEVPAYAEKLIDTFTPGPITFVLPSNGTCAENVTAGLSTVAVRIPNHPVALKLLEQSDMPIAAPSANVSGKPSPTTADHVWSDLQGKISGILDGGPTGVGLESTVVDCTGRQPVILRPGGVTAEDIESVTGSVNHINPQLKESIKPASPGMKYKHYAPSVPLWLVKGPLNAVQTIIDKEQSQGKRVGLLASSENTGRLTADQVVSLGDSLAHVATNLYDALRSFKKTDVDLIVCTTFPEVDIGQAIMNRLQKAATKHIDHTL